MPVTDHCHAVLIAPLNVVPRCAAIAEVRCLSGEKSPPSVRLTVTALAEKGLPAGTMSVAPGNPCSPVVLLAESVPFSVPETAPKLRA